MHDICLDFVLGHAVGTRLS